jgi:hypothetical protein
MLLRYCNCNDYVTASVTHLISVSKTVSQLHTASIIYLLDEFAYVVYLCALSHITVVYEAELNILVRTEVRLCD